VTRAPGGQVPAGGEDNSSPYVTAGWGGITARLGSAPQTGSSPPLGTWPPGARFRARSAGVAERPV